MYIYIYIYDISSLRVNVRFVYYSYNKSQRDALFLNFILVKNSISFGQIYCPSSVVLILFTQQ